MPATADLTNPIFTDADAARKHFQGIRWPNGAHCPFCGQSETVKELGGKSMGPGWYHCKDCRKKFTAAVGTIYERSHIPMTKWLLATHLMCASKKGMSAHQLHRMIGLPYKTAWFMAHRIREGMRDLNPSHGPLGGSGRTIEFDETYVGGKEKNKHRSKRKKANIGGAGKEAVFALVERSGKVRSHHVPNVSAKTLRPIMDAQIAEATRTVSDDGGARARHGEPNHHSVNHSIGEYVRGDIHTNTIESYFATMKRGITGVYHHVSAQHLKRYLAEFDFRYNERSTLNVTDAERATKAVAGVVGKRVTYQQSNDRQNDVPF
ncbi:putative transposase for insertion sequence element [Hyphomicrobium denitrificans 1NES1]|uniref:Putative transposase for insertion sequence element n=1 Tax=Hyphomicrobium denitrificans 1NES1 TaxID=670307 RepID=N0BC58_9HYPH|nr:IS1595 family transposase [Hyphomicrobium denitrificans]AGK58091.1 putative transposase for insertion sequence element [Hyphomicrobium denitrificans 1NES1]